MVHIVGQVKSTVYDAIMRYIDYENMRISDSELCLSGAFFILYFLLPGLGYCTVQYNIPHFNFFSERHLYFNFQPL